jgi:cytoskeletal protein RodZ
MKITLLLFVVISCATLMLGASSQQLAQQTSPESAQNRENHQKEGKLPDGRQTTASLAEREHAPNAATSKRVPRKQLPNNREHAVSKTIVNPNPAGSHNSAGIVKNGVLPAGTIKNTQRSAPAASAVRSSVPPRNNGRHSGANPAVIGGTVNSSARNTAGINGTSAHRRP